MSFSHGVTDGRPSVWLSLFSKLTIFQKQFTTPALIFPRFISNSAVSYGERLMKLSKYVSCLGQFELVSGSDISILNQPIGHVQNYW